MDKRLHLLETFVAQGADGKRYSIHAYEHLSKLDGAPDLPDNWMPTGQAEYKLADGQRVAVAKDGTMTVAGSGVRLTRGAEAPASRANPRTKH